MSDIDWESAAVQFDAEADWYLFRHNRSYNAWVSAFNRASARGTRIDLAADLARDLAVMSA